MLQELNRQEYERCYNDGFIAGLEGTEQLSKFPCYVFGYNLGQLAAVANSDLKKKGLESLLKLLDDVS